MRDELGRVMAMKHYPDQSSLGRGKPSATAKGQPAHPLVALPTARQHRLAPWSLKDGASLSLVSQALQAQVRGKKMTNLLEESFKPALLTPGEKKVSWSIPSAGIEGRAALAVPLHCTSPIPAATTLYLCAPTPGHFLPTLFSPSAGNKYVLLF